MRKNIGSTDEWIRIVLGMTLAGAGLIFNSWWGLLGFIPLATALSNICPIYLATGLSTAKKSFNAKVNS